jgi:hypothetical protein
MHSGEFEPAIPAGEEVTLFQKDEMLKDKTFSGTLIRNREISVKVSSGARSREDLGRVLLRE